MDLELYIFSDLPYVKQTEVACLVSSYTKGELGEKPQMLPKEPLDIWEKFLGVVALRDEEFAGYVGAVKPERHNETDMSEVGSLWVPLQYRRRGTAHKLVDAISKNLFEQGYKPYAFCNPLSKDIFIESGYIEAGEEEISPTAFSICETCPMKPGNGGCCDDTVIYER